ncbi:MAG: ATP-binding protein [Candidatus Xenobiia bacterium LiM19]
MDLEILGRQNFWWTDGGRIVEDYSIKDFENASLKWYPYYLESIDWKKDAVHVVYGPRQVGKTTSFKLLIKSLINNNINPRKILYFNCEEAVPSNPQRLADILRVYISWIRAGDMERIFIFLDEVTYISDWERAIKILSEEGKLQGITLLATGSHLMGMRRGAEKLPGRRGEGKDILLMPLSFREYLLVLREELDGILPSFAGWSREVLMSSIEEISLRAELIDHAFGSYIRTGGFPRPMNQFHDMNLIKPEIYKLYRDAFLGDLIRIGRKESIFRELMQWILVRRENPFEWSDIARETYAGTHPTVREYIEDAEACFIFDILYKLKNTGKPFRMPRSPKKLYFKDPFIFQAMRAWAMGYPDPFTAGEDFMKDPVNYAYLLENMVAGHLKRYFGDSIFYFRDEKEIDFVIFDHMQLSALVELKYQTKINSVNGKVLKKHGGGIVLTRNTLLAQDKILFIPAVPFLALL